MGVPTRACMGGLLHDPVFLKLGNRAKITCALTCENMPMKISFIPVSLKLSFRKRQRPRTQVQDPKIPAH